MTLLTEQDLKDVLFARAFEPSGEPGQPLSRADCDVASRRARAELAEQGAVVDPGLFVAQRARVLRERVDELHPRLARWRDGAVWKGPPIWLVLLLSVLVGLGVDRLGNSERINLLSFPLFGLILWNLAVYLMMLLSPLFSRSKRSTSEGQASRRTTEGVLARVILWLAAPQRFWRGRLAWKGSGDLTVNMQRYLRDWLRVGEDLHVKRAKVSLHLAALGVMLGAIGGLYLRGLVLDYQASWSSTFLSDEQVSSLLGMLFAPAAAQLGMELPDVSLLRGPDQSGPAAFWIHAWALTSLWLVIVPRGSLALFSSWRARRLAGRLPFDLEGDAYFLRLLSADRGEETRALVQSYSFEPAPRAAEGMTTLLLDLLGGRTRVERSEPYAYGDPLRPLEADEQGSLCIAVLFSLAQSAEYEVHAAFLQELKVEAGRLNSPVSLLVVVEEGAFLDRLPAGEEGQARLLDRRRSWQRVLQEAGVQAVMCRLDGWSDPLILERAREVLLPMAGAPLAS